MRNRILRALSLLLALALLVSSLTFAASAATSPTGYEETADWLNTNPNAPTDYAYSIAVVGDTQSLVKKDLTNGTNYMASIYSWLSTNASAKKIQYVLGVGDITEYTENFDSSFDGSWTYDDEWAHAKAAITLLDNKIPYSLCRGGGHDTVKKFNEYFGTHDYFTGNVDGTYAAGDYTSAYYAFEVGSAKYLIVTLDWNPSDAILAWADGVIAANSDRRVILTTHAYLAADGTLIGSSDSHSAVPSTNNGVDIYEKLVSKHDNIQLVISGHDSSSNLVYRQDARESGSTVTSLLVDPQTFDSKNNGETGMVCMLYFSEDGSTVNTEWISTVREQYYKVTNQHTIDLANAELDVKTRYGVIPAQYAKPADYPFVAFKRVNGGEWQFIKAYQTLYADSSLGLTTNSVIAIHSLYGGNEATRLSEEHVVLMRRDFENNATAAYNNMGYFVHKATVDLGGFTLTNTSDKLVFRCEGKAAATNDVSFNVINGDVVLTKKALLEFGDVPAGTKSINVTIDNVDVSFGEGATVANVFSYSDGNRVGEYSVTVKNSTINLVDNAPDGAQILPKHAYDAAHLVFDVQDTVKVISLETPYGTIPKEYASAEEYPFIAFVGDEVIASKNAFIDESGCLERALRSKNTGDGAVIILRRDFELPAQGFLYTNYQKGTFVIDLMGNTLTSTYSEHLFSSNGTQVHDTNTVVKNGTLVSGKGLWSVSTNANAPNKTQSITFENLNITVAWSHVAFHNNSKAAGKVNINYVNCNITMTGSVSGIFQAGKNADDTNFVTDITVTGGSLTLDSFPADKFVMEYNGGSVKFLPDENGEYFKVKTKSTSATIGGDYTTDKGAKQLVKFGTDGAYGVYLLRVADKLVTPKASLSMHSSFLYNLYVPVKDFITAIKLDGVSYGVGALPVKEIGGVKYWHVEKQIGVNEAGRSFALVVESDVQGQTWNLGVISYADTIVNGNYNNAEKTLAKDILAYVRAAYVYENTADMKDVCNAIDKVIGEDYAVNPTTTEAKESINGLSGAGLLLGSKPAFYFIPEHDAANYTFTVNGAAVTTEITTVEGKTAILVYTYAYAITDTVTYTVSGTDISGEYNLSAYLSFANGTGNASLVDLVNALWQYSDSAKAYKAQAN